MSDIEVGTAAASPIPTPMRATSSIVKPVPSPNTTVMRDQRPIPIARIVRRFPRSAQRAIGIPASTKNTAKAKPVRSPSDVSDIPRSCLISSANRLTSVRSTALRTFAIASRSST
jgi:hypothetical protein